MTDFLLLAILGAAMIAAGIPLYRGRVPPNIWYGVRLPRTLRDRDAWYRANRAFGRALMIGGAAVAAAAVVGSAFGARLDDELAILAVMVLTMAALVIGLARALWMLRRP